MAILCAWRKGIAHYTKAASRFGAVRACSVLFACSWRDFCFLKIILSLRHIVAPTKYSHENLGKPCLRFSVNLRALPSWARSLSALNYLIALTSPTARTKSCSVEAPVGKRQMRKFAQIGLRCAKAWFCLRRNLFRTPSYISPPPCF